MATIINTPATREASDSGAAGWAVAVAVLLAVGILALFVWPGIVRNSAVPAETGSTINVSLPAGTTGGTDTSGTSGTGETGSNTGGTVTP